MALKVVNAVLFAVLVLLLCALDATARRQECCYGRRSVPHGETVLTIPSCCVSFTCADGDIHPTHFGGVGASGCCEFGGRLYPDGSTLSAHCLALVCVGGEWNYNGRIQDCCEQCTLHNTGHVTTFDNNHYHWAGPCNYTVTQTGTSLHPSVGVFTTFEPCHGSYCLQQTTFKDGPHTVVTLSHVHADATSALWVNGNKFTVPPTGIHSVTVGGITYPLLALQAPFCLVVLGSSGFMLLHCRYRLDVWVYPTHSSQLYGLCGRFNFNPVDDMTARDGTVYPVQLFPLAFPESWRTADQTSPLCSHCVDCTNPSKGELCNADRGQSRAYYVRCAKLLHPVLAVDKQLEHLVDACQLELCLLHQAGIDNEKQELLLLDQLRVAQLSKSILARTMGDYVPVVFFAPLEGMCQPGSSWQQDCNACSCTDGVPPLARCTRRACPSDYVPELGEPQCTNGSRWRSDDCNVCECIRQGQVCSLRDCSAGTQPVTEGTTTTVTLPPVQVCSLPRDAGTCQGFTLKWYFDIVTRKCTQFYYTTCGGNQNRFDTEQECQLFCGSFVSTSSEIPSKPRACFADPPTDYCGTFVTQYYYNSTKDLCKPFTYGGCLGSSNRFETFEHCRSTCGGQASEATTVATRDPSVCHMQWDAGTCSMSLPVWYYHAETDRCYSASYSGCGGNGNNFDSLEECMRTCGGTGTTKTTTGCHIDFSLCPKDCPITFVLDPTTYCPKCVCETTTDYQTSPTTTATTCPPDYMVCPAYCRTTFITDYATGCRKCVCDYPPLS